MRGIFLRLFFIIANSMEIHAVKMPQKMPNKTPKIARQEQRESWQSFFRWNRQFTYFIFCFFYWNIFTLLCGLRTKLQIGLKAYKLYAKSAASLGKCSALAPHRIGATRRLLACLHLRLGPEGSLSTYAGVGQVRAQLPLITKCLELLGSALCTANAIEVNSNIKRTIYACFELD